MAISLLCSYCKKDTVALENLAGNVTSDGYSVMPCDQCQPNKPVGQTSISNISSIKLNGQGDQVQATITVLFADMDTAFSVLNMADEWLVHEYKTNPFGLPVMKVLGMRRAKP